MSALSRSRVTGPAILRPLRDPSLALLWSGLSLSAIGDQLYAVALTWIAVEVFGVAAGYLAALSSLVLLLAVLGIGRWADGWRPRQSMVRADLARASVLLLVVAVWIAESAPSGLMLIVAVLALAAGQAVFQPALQMVLAGLVRDPALLPAANGLLDTTDRSARLLGPGLIALLSGLLPLMHFLTIDALSFILSAAALVLIGRRRPDPPMPPAAIRQTIIQGIVRGIRAMRGHRLLGFFLATAGPINGAWYAVFYLALPLMLAQRATVGGGLGDFGLVISAYGCTNLAATLVFGGRPLPVRPQFQMLVGTVISGLGMLLLGLASLLPGGAVVPGFAAAAAFGAVGGPMKDIPMAVLRQTRLPQAEMAPAMRVTMAANSIGMLLAMSAMPRAIMQFGLLPMVIACSLVVTGLGLLGLVRLGGWHEAAGPQAGPAC